MAMKQKATVLLEVGTSDSLAAGTFDVERGGPQYDVLSIEGAVALADRHCRLPRVVPHRCEAIRFRVEAGDSGSGTFCSISIEECEVRLQELAVLNHVLLARRLCHNGFSIRGEKRLDHIPLSRKLRQELLTGPRCC